MSVTHYITGNRDWSSPAWRADTWGDGMGRRVLVDELKPGPKGSRHEMSESRRGPHRQPWWSCSCGNWATTAESSLDAWLHFGRHLLGKPNCTVGYDDILR